MSNYLSLKETANILEISATTVTNWEKHGLLISDHFKEKLVFEKNSVLRLKDKLDNGEAGRLSSRANKKQSEKKFIPEEYLESPDDLPLIQNILDIISDNELDLQKSLFVVCLKRFVDEKILASLPLHELLKFYGKKSSNQNVVQELNKWQHSIQFDKSNKHFKHLFKSKIPAYKDILGILYQSLITEGHKSKEGAYYTPDRISNEIINSYPKILKADSKILDPCCGTGQFLISAALKIKKHARVVKPTLIWGYDVDPVAVQIARLNLMMIFKEFDFSPNIYHRNVLYNFSYDDKSDKFRNFDLIVGNPPWGAEFKIEQSSLLKDKYPEILSFESYSYFILIALNMLKNGGILSFILPESVLNIRTHKDIRSYILKHTQIMNIEAYGRVFKNVFTPVVRLDLKKSVLLHHEVTVKLQTGSYPVQQSRFLKNMEFIYDIYKTPGDEQLIQKIYALPHTTLAGQADWALGIVTGNNAEFISTKRKTGVQEIIKGTDIRPFYLGEIKQYVQFDPGKFQQMAPLQRYRVAEKLVYKFISSRLIFAYDNKRRLSLNSSNILIPKVPGYPILSIMALFNSRLYQYLFIKMFFTHKVLRSHLEQLPLPLLNPEKLIKLKNYSERIMLASADRNFYSSQIAELNKFVYEIFGLTTTEINLIEKEIEG